MDAYRRWKEIERARKLLRLPQRTTRLEIQDAYRKRCRELHPDSVFRADSSNTEEELQKVNQAYRMLIDFTDRYQIDLSINEDGMTDDEWWFHHFGSDPVWGKTQKGNE